MCTLKGGLGYQILLVSLNRNCFIVFFFNGKTQDHLGAESHNYLLLVPYVLIAPGIPFTATFYNRKLFEIILSVFFTLHD